MAPEPPSPSASTVLLPFLGAKPRRGSLASISSRTAIDKDVLSQALDDIHTTASRSDTLTSFHDYDGGSGRAGPKELVSSGVSGLYNRFKQSMSGATPSQDARRPVQSRDSRDSSEIRSPQGSTPVSRGKSSHSAHTPAPDVASIHNASTGPSPVASSSNIERETTASFKPAGRRSLVSDARSQPVTEPSSTASSMRRVPPPDLVKSNVVSNTAESRPERDVGHNQGKRTNGDAERADTETPFLSRILSQTEDSKSNPPLSLRKPTLKPGSEDPVADSDSADDGVASVLPSSVSATNISVESSVSNAKDPRLTLQTDVSRPPMVHAGVSHLPGFAPSRASSLADGGDRISFGSALSSLQRPVLEPSPNLNIALQRRRTTHKALPTLASHLTASSHLQRKLLRKEFWMLDENARVCFSCGQSFSTFRRKHHCRTCGQIFDAKCTTLIPGKAFGQPGSIRLCTPCEKRIFDGDDDDSSTFTDDEDEYERSPARQLASDDEDMQSIIDGFSRPGTAVTTPSIGIPVSRRNREAKRRSAVIEFDTQPTLARPNSSHSLISMNRRPRSSSHRRRHSRHTSARSLRSNLDERGPFSQHHSGDWDRKVSLPAFHNDNVIDPDLAPFLSDDGSEEDEHTNIMSAIDGGNGVSPGERERFGLSGLFASALRKGRSRHGDKANSSVRGVREDDTPSHFPKSPKHSRSRNFSNGSMSYNRPSPRRSRSALQFTAWGEGGSDNRPISSLVVPQTTISQTVFSSAIQNQDRPRKELNTASHDHARRLLAQLLSDAQIASPSSWEKALMPVILQCTDDVDPDVQQGDDMDIRQYIKFKKVPGGRPTDTGYVSGVVFSKNIAIKTMARSIHQPRIAIVTFAIEYARHEAHFMSLDPVIAQEKEYLQNLVGRIVALRPTLLLVQRHVSGLALRMLEEARITVVCNIKQSVLAAVARVTQTVLIKSIDKLGIDPSHLGRCDSFEVKTFLAEGLRKTYIYLAGCEPDLGCTIVLRGADTKTLRKIKRVAEFMCYVAYNLKLENYLMRDQFIYIPNSAQSGLKAHDDGDNEKPAEMSALYEDLRSAREALQMGVEDVEGDTQFKYANFEESIRRRILSASPFIVYMQPYLLTKLRDLESRLASFQTLSDLYAAADTDGGKDEDSHTGKFELVQSDQVNVPPSKDQPKAVREFLHAVHEAQLEKAMHSFQTSERQWETFISGEVNPFDPFSHQKIVVLYSTISIITSAPCIGPELLGIGFYAGFNRAEDNYDEDLTLGQYIEDLCLSANSTCRECSTKMYDHHRQYVHGYGQLDISILRQTAKMRGYNNSILMWSTCRICAHETTVTPMSEYTWKYSFAKYLEMSFWSSPLHPRAGSCKHDIHKDFLRFFGFQDHVVKFQYDAIDIYDVIVPRSRVTWKVEADLNMKNEQYTRFVQRLQAFTNSIVKRLNAINVDTLEEKKAMEATDYLQELRQRVDDDYHELLEKLQLKYATSRYYELIPFNRALRLMDEKAIVWDDIFTNFERDYFLTETDIRQIATLQLRNMFLESQPAASDPASETSDAEDVADGKSLRRQGLQSSLERNDIPPEKAHDVLSSVVEENKGLMSLQDESSAPTIDPIVAPLDEGTVHSPSPLSEQEQVVERDDVKHLDLAVPSRTPEELSPVQPESHDLQLDQPAPSTANDDDSYQTPFAIPPKPLSSGLLERIEQIRNARTDGNADAEISESKIPRLVNLKKREAGTPQPPPLMRAQSSPTRVSLHGTDSLPDSSIDTLVGGPVNADASQQEKRISERLGVARLANKVGKMAPSFIPRSIPKAEAKIVSSVSKLARHFEEMSREFEKERLKERRQRALRSQQTRANPLASSRPVVEVYENATDAVGEKARDESIHDEDMQDDQIDRRHVHEATTTIEDNEPTEQKVDEVQEVEAPEESQPTTSDSLADTDTEGEVSELEPSTTRSRQLSDPLSGSSSAMLTSPTSAPDLTELGPDLNIPESKKHDWFNMLSDYWSRRSASGWSNLEYPLHANEHVFEDSDIIVRDDEPSSVIALSLSCADYKNKMNEFRSHPSRQTPMKGQVNMSQANMAKARSAEAQKDIEASLLSVTATHTKYSFTHGQVKASCKIFYPESFDALRRRCGVADRFVESMSRCLKFDSKGGKTKSLFLKTLDNRFIIKSLQEVELKAFTKFAPDYFDFMSWTLFHGVPSVIAKMFGVFQVTIRNPAAGVDFSYYLLVMENLFYERSPNRRFDLKGSMRNRKIESTGTPDEVLLDENLVETIFEKPLFMREQSCRLLQASVFNDTLWLCRQNVMDYSLMAGFDDPRRELTVGIIDCIRTYTWDKKLESWIKDRGKNRPTITSPKDYRNRFRVSMTQYVLQAPSCWHQFQAQLAAHKKLKDADREETEYMEAERDEQGRTVISQ